jgi:hypothetical protein
MVLDEEDPEAGGSRLEAERRLIPFDASRFPLPDQGE